jgi:hypothetical protein
LAASPIEMFAHHFLDQEEVELADHLAELLDDDKYNTFLFLVPILPRYWKKKGNVTVALPPRSIFKTLSYVHSTAGLREFAHKTRDFLADVSGFLEGCLFHLQFDVGPYAHSNLTFGQLVAALEKRGSLSKELASNLWAFNKTVNISSKHFDSFPMPEGLDEHTFSVRDAACAFVMMRKLAIPLFELLRQKGVLDAAWPSFDKRLIYWFPMMEATSRKGLKRTDG